jgi:hypothetical protein
MASVGDWRRRSSATCPLRPVEHIQSGRWEERKRALARQGLDRKTFSNCDEIPPPFLRREERNRLLGISPVQNLDPRRGSTKWYSPDLARCVKRCNESATELKKTVA